MNPATERKMSLTSTCFTEKPDEFQISRNSDEGDERIDEFKEPNDYVDCTPMPLKKANCLPIAWLLFLMICSQIRPSVSKPTGRVKCPNANDIKYRDPKTGLIDHCMVCPECIPSQQYSIPCGSTVDLGTGLGRCEDCTAGTFSDKYDKRPCQICTICTNKVYLQNCTKDQNAKCGPCKPGYIYDSHNFGCIKDIRKTTTTTAVTTTVKTTTAPLLTSKKPRSSPTTTKIIDSASKPHTFRAKTSASPFINYASPGVSEGPVKQSSNNTLAKDGKASQLAPSQQTNPWIIATVVSLGTALSFILIASIAYNIYRKKRSRSCSSRKADCDEEAGTELLERTNNDMKLKDFMNKEPDACDAVCTMLFDKGPGGLFYFDSVAIKFSMSDEEREAIKSVRYTGGNPTRELMNALCARDPKTKVKQFAKKVNSIKACAKATEVYNKLKPFFTVTPNSS